MKLLKFLVLFLLIFSGGGIAYFTYTMTIGDTYGLYEKLEKLNSVVSVEDYYTYEGNAFFTLLLSDKRRITLGSVGNQDLVRSDGMMIDQVGPYKILCKHSSGRAFSNGIHTTKISSDYLNQEYLDNVQNLIKHYEDIEKLFSTTPQKFYYKTEMVSDSVNSFIVCKI